MAGAGGIKAGSAYVELSLKNTVQKGLDSASAQLKAFGLGVAAVGAAVGGLGAAITAPFLEGAKQFAEVGSSLDKMSLRTGIAATTLSELSYAAKISAVDFDKVEVAIKMMQKAIAGAEDGSSKAAKALGEVGLSARDLVGLSPDKQFQTIAKALASIEDPAQRTQAALALFGRSGTQLLPLITRMGELRAEAKTLNVTMSKDEVAAAVKLREAWTRLTETTAALFRALGSAVAPAITEISNLFAKIIAGAIELAKKNQNLLSSIFHLGKVLTVAGGLLAAVGTAIVGLGFTLGGLSLLISAAASAFGVLATILTANILSPIVLSIAIIGSLGAAWIYTSKTVRSAATSIASTVTGIATEAKAAFGIVFEAVRGGDIESAVSVLWAFIKMEFVRGWEAIKTYTIQGVNAVAQYWPTIGAGAKQVWINLRADAETTWLAWTTGLANTVEGFKIIFSVVGDIFAKVIQYGFLIQLEVVNAVLQKIGSTLIGLLELTKQISKGTAAEMRSALKAVDDTVQGTKEAVEKKAPAFFQKQREDAKKQITENNEKLNQESAKIQEQRSADLKKVSEKAAPKPLFQSELETGQERVLDAELEYADAMRAAESEAVARAYAARRATEDANAEAEHTRAVATGGLEAALEGMTVIGQFGGRGLLGVVGGDSSGKQTAGNTAAMLAEQKKTNKLLEEQEPSGEFL